MAQHASTDETSRELFDDFLAEVQALEDFRAQYSRRYEFEGLGRQDQDVQRLMEAMAFYSARTRRTAERATEEYKRLALERLFPYVLSPLPEMALLHPVLGANMQETRQLPTGAPITLTPVDPELANSAKSFRTIEELTVFPLHIVERSVKLQRQLPDKGTGQLGAAQPQVGWTLRVEVAASPAGPGKKRYYDDVQLPLTEIRLHLNPTGDVLLCLRAFDALRESFVKVTCRFLSDGVPRHEIERRGVRFGMRKTTSVETLENPIEVTRRAIHFPLSDFCIGIDLSGGPSEWDSLLLEFELNENWPSGIGFGDGSFLLNATPVENIQRTFAEPVEVTGQRLRLPISHPEPDTGACLREVLGVYLGDPRVPGARKALFPNLLVQGGYAVEINGAGRTAWIKINPDLSTLVEPQTLYIDALWYQPAPLKAPARVSTGTADLGAVRWGFATPTRDAQMSPVGQDITALERLLDLHGVQALSVVEFRYLLDVLGVAQSEIFDRVPRYLARVTTEFVPDSQAALGGVRCYDLGFGKVPTVLIPSVRHLVSLLPAALAAWTGDAEIKVTLLWDEQPELKNTQFSWRSADV